MQRAGMLDTWARRALAAAAGALLAACSSAQGDIQQAADRNYLSYMAGKPYAAIAAEKKLTVEGMMYGDRAAGELISTTALAGGDTLYRHVDRYQSGTMTSSVAGIYGKDSATYSYRLLYFRVSPDGVVRDTANGFVPGETQTCIGWIGGIFQKCNNELELRSTVAGFDAVVKTSAGQPLASWGVGA